MTLSIPLPPDIEQRLEIIAARSGRSKAAQAQLLVELGLDELESSYRAVDVRDRVRDGTEAVTSLEELKRQLGRAS